MFTVYTDESSQTQCHFMVLGGILVRDVSIGVLEESFLKIRQKHNIWGEFKWTKVSRAKLNAYTEFITFLITAIKQNKLHFHSLVIDTHKINNALYNEGDRDLGLTKFIYQLLIKFGRLYARHGNLQIRLDNRNSAHDLNTLRHILNYGLRKRWQIALHPYRTLEFVESHDHDIMQAVDILLGAIAHFRNAKADVAVSPNKQQLAEHILQLSGLPNFTDDTPRGHKKFSVWNFRFSDHKHGPVGIANQGRERIHNRTPPITRKLF